MDYCSKSDIPEKAQKYYNKVKDAIKYCAYDQPYDGGDVIWLFGERTDLSEIFDLYRIPEKYREVIADNMVCQGCGHDDFDIYSDVCTESRVDVELEIKLETANRKYKKKIDGLLDYITKYPSLVLNNTLASKIHKEIMAHTLPVHEIKAGTYYRSRVVKDSDVYSSENLGPPRQGIASVGRYNHSGQSVLYLSKTRDCSVAEVLGGNANSALIWVQEYDVADIGNILDLSITGEHFLSLDSVLFTALLNNSALKKRCDNAYPTWKPEYLLTNFVADTAKLAGYTGILYNSAVAGDLNIVLFDAKHEGVKPIGNPKIFIHEPKKEDHLFDF